MKYTRNPPPREFRYVICDVCGFRYRVKDVIKRTDTYSRQNGLVVCKKCYDPTNPQDRPITINENIVTNIDKLRSDKLNPIFFSNDKDDRLPSQPLNLKCIINPLYNYIDLYWDVPEDQGSSLILGYVITRSAPQSAVYTVLTSNTYTGRCNYSDTDSDPSIAYSYKIAAINGFGQGPFSLEAFWPNIGMVDPDNITYLVTSTIEDYLVTGSGDYLIL